MLRQLAPILFAFGLTAACHSSAQVSTTPEPTPAPAPDPAPAADPAPDPEEVPVMKEEPKNLEIQKNVIRLKRGIKIQFETDSAGLKPESDSILDEVADVMSKNERIRVRVEGHTDNTGAADHNKTLSEQRASSVKDYIVSKGIAADRLESTGCGQDVPLGDNKTEDGRQENRRVEFVILRRKRKVEPCQLYKPGEGRRNRDGGGAGGATPPATP